jgi:hypothetical protein
MTGVFGRLAKLERGGTGWESWPLLLRVREHPNAELLAFSYAIEFLRAPTAIAINDQP